jgi:glycosyltransferase involved in cell wall biosynthesis
MKYSFIISAWGVSEFIEECLDSVCFQNTSQNHEVLLGIDNCEETLKKVIQIQKKYTNLKFYWMTENVGTYIVRNTLFQFAKGTHIVQFDSDDVMDRDMIKHCDKLATQFDVVKFLGQNFEGKKKIGNAKAFTSPGIFKREVFEKFGGYENWRIVADSEFKHRIKPFTKQITYLKVLMKRRLHVGSLMHVHPPAEDKRKTEALKIDKKPTFIRKVKPILAPCYQVL